MGDDEPRPRGYQAWADDRGFKMAKLFPADWESAIAELYFGDLVWAYVSLEGVDEAATGVARVRNARVVVEFCSEPGNRRASGISASTWPGHSSSFSALRRGSSRTKRDVRLPQRRDSARLGGPSHRCQRRSRGAGPAAPRIHQAETSDRRRTAAGFPRSMACSRRSPRRATRGSRRMHGGVRPPRADGSG
jgi:hypothetical protein